VSGSCLFGFFRLGDAGQPFRQDVCCAHIRCLAALLRSVLGNLCDNQHFLKTAEVGGGLYLHCQKRLIVPVWRDARNRTHGKALGINPVATAGNNLLASVYFLVGHDVTDVEFALRVTAQNSL
jgi:hypothetical protein